MTTRLQSLLVLLLFLLPLGSGAAAQTANTNTNANTTSTAPPNTVGNPQLRDFELPGTRTTPANPPPVVAAPPPPPPTISTRPAAPPAENVTDTATPAAREAPTRPVPQRRSQRQPAVTPPAASPTPATTAPSLPSPTSQTVPQSLPAQPSPQPDPAPVADAAPRPGSQEQVPWLPIGLAAAAVLALLAFLKLRRRPREDEAAQTETSSGAPAELAPDPLFARRAPAETPPTPPSPAPRPAAAAGPAAPAADRVSIRMRPWIELDFKPARAAATLTEANVQFELTLVNSGNVAAHNIRVGMRMFNAGPDQEREIEAYYAEPFPQEAPAAVPILDPGMSIRLNSTVSLPKEQVREVEIQGRRLFIPTVAFNVLYEWSGGKSGQTSMSYLVGREAETPVAKMGGFRLDLGPRLYRSVGQRPIRLARTV